MIHLIIVEDSPTTGAILMDYMAGEDITVDALYTTGEAAIEQMPNNPLPDVMLIDIGLPGISGIELIRILKERYPTVEMIVQSILDDSETIVKAIRAGASGYVLKASSRSEILNALIEVKRGGSFLTPRVAKKVLSELKKSEQNKADEKPTLSRMGLTEREEEILQCLISGISPKETAKRLYLSVFTVSNHTRAIYEKLQVHSRREAVAKATQPTKA